MGKLINGKLIAEKVLKRNAKQIIQLKKQGIIPKLAVILVGADKPSQIYVNKKKEAAEKIGLGFVLYKIVKKFLLGNSLVVVASLLVGGILLIWLEKIHKEKDSDVGKIENLSSKQSFMIGLAQSISIIPGVSRAAATILGGMFLGLKKETAVEFSFLLAVPTMLAATGLDLVKSDLNFSAQELSVLAVGFIGSFIAALLVVKWFIKFIQTNNFFWFGVYRIILAVIFLFLLS